jgi:hypothetical protein
MEFQCSEFEPPTFLTACFVWAPASVSAQTMGAETFVELECAASPQSKLKQPGKICLGEASSFVEWRHHLLTRDCLSYRCGACVCYYFLSLDMGLLGELSLLTRAI